MLQDQGRVGEYRNMCLNDIDLEGIDNQMLFFFLINEDFCLFEF